MGAFRVYLEANFNGAYVEGSMVWVDVSDRCPDIGAVSIAVKGEKGQPIISPPSSLVMDNRDGFFVSAPMVAGGDFEGPWAGRRVKIDVELGAAVKTLGVFKIDPEAGVVIRRDGLVDVKLESLADQLDRVDASRVSNGLGWHQQIPWTKSVDLLRKPEARGALTLPESPLAYEVLDHGVSLVGRPGDYVSGKFNTSKTVLATDCCYNEDSDVFVYSTLDGLWALDRVTGGWTAITGAGLAAIPEGWDILRVWYVPTATLAAGQGSGYYLVMCAQPEVASQDSTDGSGYWQPKDHAYKWTDIRIYAHDYATPLFSSAGSYRPGLAPVIYREIADDTTLGSVNNATVGGEVWNDGANYKAENLAVPFGQYVAWLLLRRDQSGEVPGTTGIDHQDVKYATAESSTPDPLDSINFNTPNKWVNEPRVGAGDRQGMNLDDLRTGRGYYSFYVLLDSAVAMDNARDAGVRYSLGQGPLVDISLKHDGNTRYDFWLTFCNWNPGSYQWSIQVVGVRAGGDYPASPVYLGAFVVPTFVVCDIFDAGGAARNGGGVFVGWHRYNTGTDFTYGYSGHTANVMGAESGVAALWANTCSFGSTPSLDQELRLMTFTPESDTDPSTVGNRYYWTTPPPGGAGGEGTINHASGRWVPVAAGFFRWTVGLSVFYSLALSCFDRSDCITDPRNGHAGQPYHMMRVLMLAGSTTTFLSSDGHGDFGADTGYSAALPIMGLTRLMAYDSDELAAIDDPAIYFFSAEGQGLFAMRESNTWKATFLGRVFASDSFLGLGTLAVAGAGTDDVEISGVTNPVFPLTAATRWPVGEYYGFTYSTIHSGRLPLLELSDLTVWDAIGLVTMAGDAHFYFSRTGASKLSKIPTGNPTPTFSLTPSDYATGSRRDAPAMNSVTRSVNDVAPGDVKVTTTLMPKSAWNLAAGFSGMGVYPTDIQVKCIAGGLVSESLDDDPRVGKTNWAWREASKRITITAAAASSANYLFLETLEDVEVGDVVQVAGDTRDLVITSIASYSTGVVTLSDTPLVNVLAGDTVWVLKASSGHYSSEIWLDPVQGTYRGVSAVASAASAGDLELEVTAGHPFSVGSFFRVGKDDGAVDDFNGPYRVIRIRRGREEARPGTFDIVEFEAVSSKFTGLKEDVAAGDPIAVWMNIGPATRSLPIGQTGIVFTIQGGGGGEADLDTEQPALEGDRVTLSYPGLVMKKNSASKVTAKDLDSIRANGVKTQVRVPANKLLDFGLATMDAARRLRRGTDGRVILELTGVSPQLPDGTWMVDLPPLAVGTVEDDILLADRADDNYKATFMLTGHKVDQQANVSVTLEEVPSATPGRAASTYAKGETWTPADLPDLQLWLRAESLRAQGYVDGDSVPLLLDESGNGNHATQDSATASTWPTVAVESGVYTLKFDAASSQRLVIGDVEMIDNGSGQSITALVRKETAGVSNYVSIISKNYTSGQWEWFLWTGSYAVHESGTTPAADWPATGLTDSWAVLHAEWDPGNPAVVYKNGTLNDTATVTITDVDDTAAEVFIGAANLGTAYALTGRIVEIVITLQPLSADDKTRLNNYMKRTYPALVGAPTGFSSGFSSGFGE